VVACGTTGFSVGGCGRDALISCMIGLSDGEISSGGSDALDGLLIYSA
jgi:hypothetical protein